MKFRKTFDTLNEKIQENQEMNDELIALKNN